MKKTRDVIKERVGEMESENERIPSRLMKKFGVSGVCMGLLVLGCVYEGGYSVVTTSICIGVSMFNLDLVEEIFLLVESKRTSLNVLESVIVVVSSFLILIGFTYLAQASYEKDARGLLIEMGIMGLICNRILCRVVGRSFGKIFITIIAMAVIATTLLMSLHFMNRSHKYDGMKKKTVGGQDLDSNTGGLYWITEKIGYKREVSIIRTKFISPVIGALISEAEKGPIYIVDVDKGPRCSVYRFSNNEIFLSVKENFTNPTEEQFRKMFRTIGLIEFEEDFFWKYALLKSIITPATALGVVILGRYIGRMVRRLSRPREQKSPARVFVEYLMIYSVSVCVVGLISVWIFNAVSEKMIDNQVGEFVKKRMASSSMAEALGRSSHAYS